MFSPPSAVLWYFVDSYYTIVENTQTLPSILSLINIVTLRAFLFF